MNIGIYPGSFNPIHVGHIILASYITEFTEIDEVWFLVSPQNPFKKKNELLAQDERFEMLEIALKDYDKLKVSDFEFTLPQPSYTINTLEGLSSKYPKYNFSLIIGADNWSEFERWKDYDKIIEKYNIKIYPRLGHRISIPQRQKNRVEALESPIIDISATFIRESMSEGKDVRAFLPNKIYDYILQKQLYK